MYLKSIMQEFLQWVLVKEREGCVFWFKPERSLQKLSAFFEEKIDPVSDRPYEPLLLEPHWWKARFQRSRARFIGNPSSVVSALSDGERAVKVTDVQDIAIPTLQELIYQSNPTLEPLARWPHAPSMRFLPREPPSRKGYAQDMKLRRIVDTDIARRGKFGC